MHQISISCLVSLSFNLSKVDGLGVHLRPNPLTSAHDSSPAKGHQRQREKLTNNLISSAHKLNTSRPSHLSCCPVDTCLVTTPSLPTSNLMHVSGLLSSPPMRWTLLLHTFVTGIIIVRGWAHCYQNNFRRRVFLLTEMVKKC